MAADHLPCIGRFQGLFDAARMINDPVAVLAHYTSIHGDAFHYYFGGALPVLVASRPAVILNVLKTRADEFAKSEIQTVRMTEFLGYGLLTLHGAAWRQQRRFIQDGFRPAELAKLVPDMQTTVGPGLDDLAGEAAEGGTDAAEHMTRLTFAMVARLLFGAAFSNADIAKVSDAIARVQAFMVRRIVQPWLSPWFRLSGALAYYQGVRREGDAVIARHIEARRAMPAQHDLLRTLLEIRLPDTGQPMTGPQLLAEAMQLLVAGHETSATALTWALDLLARHPDTLARVRQEVDAVLGDRMVAFDDMPKLPFATAVLKETLRLYPPFWMIDRVALTDGEADGVMIPKGTRLVLFVRAAHRHPDYWRAPELFDPDRFFGPERDNERNGAWAPFGAGPRTCIGATYAMLQMLMVLTAIVRRFDFSAVSGAPAREKPLLILRPEKALFRFAPRRRLA